VKLLRWHFTPSDLPSGFSKYLEDSTVKTCSEKEFASPFSDEPKQQENKRHWNRPDNISVVGVVYSMRSWLDVFPRHAWWQPELEKVLSRNLSNM
jgi:hypothetical protein